MAGLLSGTGVHDTGGLEGSPSIWGPGWLGADRTTGLLGYTPVAPSATVEAWVSALVVIASVP